MKDTSTCNLPDRVIGKDGKSCQASRPARAMAPHTSNGGGTQQSGYAISGLAQSGQTKVKPVISTLQRHLAACGEQWLRLYRDNGHLMGDEGSRGTFYVPRATPLPGKEPEWEVTPEMIDKTGTQVRVTLVPTPDIGQLGALANALGLLKQQGLVERTEARRMIALPGSQNAEAAIKRIDLEAVKESPEYKLKQLLKYVVEQEQDPAAADFIMSLIEKGMAKEAAQSQGMANAGQPPRPPGPPGPGGGPMPGRGPAAIPGQSLPGMGQPPGTMGGRPPGAPPVNMGPGLEP